MGMSKAQRDRFYPVIKARDGEFCQGCTTLLGSRNPNDVLVDILLIHHKNGDDKDLREENMIFLCRSCNQLIPKSVQEVSKRDYTPEYKKNVIKEPLFREWLNGKMMENNFHYKYDWVIDEGAYYCNVSTETIKRYLSKVCGHPSAAFTIEAGQGGELEVWLIGHEPSRYH